MWIGKRVERGREGTTSNVHQGGHRAEGRRRVPFPILSRADPSPLSHASSLRTFPSYFRLKLLFPDPKID